MALSLSLSIYIYISLSVYIGSVGGWSRENVVNMVAHNMSNSYTRRPTTCRADILPCGRLVFLYYLHHAGQLDLCSSCFSLFE